MRKKKSTFNPSRADPSSDLIDILDKPDVAAWNNTVRDVHGAGRLKIGPINQNTIRKDKGIMVDPANKKDVSDVIASRTKVTDKVDLSKHHT